MKITPLLLIFLVFSLTACKDTGRKIAAPKPHEEQPLRSASLTEQKMCDEQARKKFREDNPRPSELTNYRSHYDPKANICYIRVDSTTAGKNSVSTLIMIYDAFEGRQYGSYMWINNQGKKYWDAIASRRPAGGSAAGFRVC